MKLEYVQYHLAPETADFDMFSGMMAFRRIYVKVKWFLFFKNSKRKEKIEHT